MALEKFTEHRYNVNMKTVSIQTLQEAKSFIRLLYTFNYYPVEMHYSWYAKEGFHALFRSHMKRDDVKFITRNNKVQEALETYELIE